MLLPMLFLPMLLGPALLPLLRLLLLLRHCCAAAVHPRGVMTGMLVTVMEVTAATTPTTNAAHQSAQSHLARLHTEQPFDLWCWRAVRIAGNHVFSICASF